MSTLHVECFDAGSTRAEDFDETNIIAESLTLCVLIGIYSSFKKSEGSVWTKKFRE
jgi:hypothetical protein